MVTIINSILVVFSYLLGSLSAGIIVCRLMGLSDPRQSGSGNPGATNVYRLHGKKAGGLALLGDVIKGIIPVLFARYAGGSEGIVAICGIAVFIGHLFPVFFRFRGGKGVATYLGVVIGTSWALGIMFIVTWFIVATLSRYSSVAGMTAAALTPLFALALTPDIAYVLGFLVMAPILIYRHRTNIERLINGIEPKIDEE
jgi:glycerol-3-phosphate acyltransferase PlsY